MSNENVKLIIFLIPPRKIINGGVMSIFSLCRESRRFFSIHHSNVIVSVYPGYKSYRKNDLFENDEYIYSFKEALALYPNCDDITLNIPEYALKEVTEKLNNSTYKGINFTVNILNQNIKYMPDVGTVSSLFGIAKAVTQTIAHNRYATQALADHYAIPTHLLSVYLDKSQYRQTSFAKKSRTILFSPDGNIHKDEVLKLLKEQLPQYKLVEINNFTYSKYKEAISDARFVITFGEGFDGYLIESSMSGTIPLAVYNDDFFPDTSYKKLPGIYASYPEMLDNVVHDIAIFEQKESYIIAHRKLFDKLVKIYRYDAYVNNLKKFYEKKYSFLPSPNSFRQMIGVAALQKDDLLRDYISTVGKLNARIDEITQSNRDYDKLLQNTQQELEELKQKYKLVIESRGWRLLHIVHKIIAKTRNHND